MMMSIKHRHIEGFTHRHIISYYMPMVSPFNTLPFENRGNDPMLILCYSHLCIDVTNISMLGRGDIQSCTQTSLSIWLQSVLLWISSYLLMAFSDDFFKNSYSDSHCFVGSWMDCSGTWWAIRPHLKWFRICCEVQMLLSLIWKKIIELMAWT